MVKHLILGAGMTGLNTAYHLKDNYFLAEKENKIGGLSGSIKENVYVFDYAEHFLRIPNKEMQVFIKKLMNGNIFSQELISAIYFKENYIPYPFQENIRCLPLNELNLCAKSIILNFFSREKDKRDFANFKEFIYYQYGEYIAEEFMIPYNEKIWTIKTQEMSIDWFLSPNFIATFNLDTILESILPKNNESPDRKQIRWYPKEGGCQALADSYKPYLSHLALEYKAKKID